MYNKFWTTYTTPQKALQVSTYMYMHIYMANTHSKIPIPPLSLSLFPHVCQHLEEVYIPDGIVRATKMLTHRPVDWPACVRLARLKFEKYFNHKVCTDLCPSTIPYYKWPSFHKCVMYCL